ncbi:MAG TPA: hypothetical protein VF219_13640 [Vicinamibacterales bacterium]
MISLASALLISTLVAESAPAQAQVPVCREWRECQQLALDAAERHDYETFHDLAWRTVQLGPRQDPALMLMLARAQCRSGRPHDALVMLQRIAKSGVAAEAITSEDFKRTRDLPEWPEVQALIEGTPPPPVRTATPSVRTADPVPSPAAAPRPAAVNQSVRLTGSFLAGGLAYDIVSRRFVVGDEHGRKLMVVSDGADRPVDLVRAESAGFHDIRAVEIDERRGDLWVASATGDEWTIHRMQLVSGRPLKAISVAGDGNPPLDLADLAVTPAGTVLAIDSASSRLLMLKPSARGLELVVKLKVDGASSVTATDDEDVVFVAHKAGIVRVDRKTKAVTNVSAGSGIRFGRIERLRWHRNSLIAVEVVDDGSRRVVRFDLNRSGRSITAATELDTKIPAAAGPTFATVAGDELSYLVVENEGSTAQFTIRRLHLP